MPPKASNKSHTLPALPEDDAAFVRLPAVLRVYPVSETSWWRGVSEGRYPQPVRLGPRMSAWRVADIRALLAAAYDDTQKQTA